ncbi:MAG: TonB-dependent receptor [Saprospiraceae bacterium]|nr:TonB-dependent receptor [Saprospiraceae bacterium]
MNTKVVFVLILLTFVSRTYTQRISGIILDENKTPIEYATVILMLTSDSSMVEFTNSARNGSFEVNLPKSDQYFLQINYLGYENYYKLIGNPEKDLLLETIQLKPGNQLLDVIEVKDYASPMTFGKDTIQYNAAAFKTQPGDMAEDLLKKLPGIEVERDGSVKALGEKVQNVLVDGKEFFGKDTKIATKNLDADAIDKVQVFDKRSDRTEFTGIDDGQRERSINLKLKEDKKIGYFGTIEAAGGTEERFKGRANINRFTPNFRTSFIGLANNINEQNFSISDYIDFMGGIGAMMSGSGGGSFAINLDQSSGLPLGLSNNQGIQKSFAGGLNLNTYFSATTSLEASVFGNHFNNKLLRNSIRENLLPESKFFSNTIEDQLSENTSGSFTLKFKTKLDSTQNLVIRANGSAGKNQLLSQEMNQVFDKNRQSLNDNVNRYDMQGNQLKLSTDLLWQKKTRKPGRIFTLNTGLNVSDQNSDVDLNSYYQIFQPLADSSKLFQNQLGQQDGWYYRVLGSWTEPLKKKRYLELMSSISNQNYKAGTDYFDIINDIPIPNMLLSHLYQNDYTQHHTGLNFIVNREKYNLTIGSKYQFSTLSGKTNQDQNGIKDHYQALLPSAFFTYRFGLSEHLNFNYFSELREPSINQLQPNINNSNPLAVYTGNPNLNPERNHNASFSYMRYNAFDFTMLYLSLQSNFTFDKITEALYIDSALVRYYTPVNIKHESTSSGRIEYETPIRPLKLKARAVLKGNYNKGLTVINERNNTVSRMGHGYNFSLENRNKDFIDLLVGYKTNKTESDFKDNNSLNQSYTQSSWYTALEMNFGERLHFKSSFDYLQVESSFSPEKTNIPLWTASITTFITQDKKWRMSLSCFDILNKNKNVMTSSQNNYSDVTVTNVLNRYLMLGLSYNIKGFKKKGGIEINMGGRE